MIIMEPSAGIELPPPTQPEAALPHPEQGLSDIGEGTRLERAPEKAAPPAPASEIAAPPPVPLPLPVPSSSPASDDPLRQALGPNLLPSVANDGDKIEPGWVHAAKVVIANTKNNPYLEGQAVADLRRKYHEKRGGTSMPRAA